MTETCALIPAAGRGARFGSAQNKVFAPLLGRPLVGWTLEAFAACTGVDAIVVIGSPDDLPRLREIADAFGGAKVRAVVPGGADRQTSVRAGLEAVGDARNVVVHDAARPCVTPALIDNTIAAAHASGAATTALPITDTLVRAEPDQAAGQVVEREGLWSVQTPQAFDAELLRNAHERAGLENFQGTDDASLVRRLGQTVRLASGSPENLKVTRPEDLALAEAILARRHPAPTLRIGYGYDVHPFANGRRLFLGGVEFPAERGLLGHSDADVVLHALCDALLGAAGLGDIGTRFPNNDPAHKNRPSIEFVREVTQAVAGAGYRIANVDVTVLAEAPKIGPLAGEIKTRIADALGVGPTQVGVKATTNEGMGFVGRGEGIAAHAVALIFR